MCGASRGEFDFPGHRLYAFRQVVWVVDHPKVSSAFETGEVVGAFQNAPGRYRRWVWSGIHREQSDGESPPGAGWSVSVDGTSLQLERVM